MGESKGEGVVRGKGHCYKGLIEECCRQSRQSASRLCFLLFFLGFRVEKEGRRTRKGGVAEEKKRTRADKARTRNLTDISAQAPHRHNVATWTLPIMAVPPGLCGPNYGRASLDHQSNSPSSRR